LVRLRREDIRNVLNFPGGVRAGPDYWSSNNRHELNSVHQCSLPGYEDIRELHYLLQPIVLEIFSNDVHQPPTGLPAKRPLSVYKRLLAKATALSYSASQSVAGQKWAANVE
jgi:hypothetical protein